MLTLPNRKKARAKLIKKYMADCGYDKAVCFSCGNASRALKNEGIETVDISPAGDLEARRWWSMAEIKRSFPGMFDATSGHLPIELMNMLAQEYRDEVGDVNEKPCYVPSGSGETVLCLSIAYPEIKFIAVYDMTKAWLRYETKAPLNEIVNKICKVHILRR